MEAPTAALAVAMMIAMAATSARSDRASASFFLRVIVFRRTLFGFGFAWSIWLGLFRPCVSSPLSRLRIRSCYFNQAASISLVLKNVPNGSSTGGAFAKMRPNRQIFFLFMWVQRFCMAENARISGPFSVTITFSPIFQALHTQPTDGIKLVCAQHRTHESREKYAS